jgi:hypothetical protein
VRALWATSVAVAAIIASLGSGDVARADLPDGQPGPKLSIGVVPQVELTQHDLRTMAAGGVDSVRVVLSWAKIERSPGHYNWAEADGLIAQAAREGVTPLAVLYGTPRWAVVGTGARCEAFACASLGPVSPSATDRFARFAGAAALRYGSGGSFWFLRPDVPDRPIRAWEIWNEPNSPAFFGPQVDPAAYGTMLSAAGSRIHLADPDAEVLVGGLATQRFSSRGTRAPLRYMRELLADPAAADAFDGVAIHPYAGGAAGVVRRVRGLRDLLVDAGMADRGLWVTEAGWASSGNRRHPLVARERGQARLLRRVFRLFAHRADRWGLRAAYWYSWRDTMREQAVCRWCAGTGLLHADSRPKRAWRHLSALARP